MHLGGELKNLGRGSDPSGKRTGRARFDFGILELGPAIRGQLTGHFRLSNDDSFLWVMCLFQVDQII